MGPMLKAVNDLLDDAELDAVGEARATQARGLAQKFDQTVGSNTATASLALPGISKELREVIDQIQEAADDTHEFVQGLFSPVGDTPKS